MTIKKDSIQVQPPTGGVYRRLAFQSQPPYTCYEMLNVFPDDLYRERERIGTRPAISIDYNIGGPITLMGELNYVDTNDDDIVKSILIIGVGTDIKIVRSDGAIEDGGSGLKIDERTYTGDAHTGNFFIGHDDDGDIVYFDPLTDTLDKISNHADYVGTAPTNCKIILNWRDRLIAADGEDPHLIWMSRQGNPFDWDLTATDVQRAVELSATKAGKIGQPVVAIIPHSNNCLVIATKTEWYVMRGDVTAQGGIQLIPTGGLSIMGRRAWCHSPDGFLWCMTNDGLYCMPPGCGDPLHSVSREKLPQELVSYEPQDYVATLIYDHRLRGVCVFMTEWEAAQGTIKPPYCGTQRQGSTAPEGSSLQVTHFFCDIRNTMSSDSTNLPAAMFYPMSIDADFEPTYALSSKLIGSEPAAYLGTKNNGVGHFERKLKTRTTHEPPVDLPGVAQEPAFASYAILGPFSSGKGAMTGLIERIQGTLGYDSRPVEWEIIAGDDAESILSKKYKFRRRGLFSLAGKNHIEHVRVRCDFFYVILRSIQDEAWAFEGINIIRQHRTGRRRLHYTGILPPTTNPNL